ncbi:MAG: hypothetical protein IKD06_06005, partial [Clostridia bacterium]|nr:hypothetical protein [Clostridia bacterium]
SSAGAEGRTSYFHVNTKILVLLHKAIISSMKQHSALCSAKSSAGAEGRTSYFHVNTKILVLLHKAIIAQMFDFVKRQRGLPFFVKLPFSLNFHSFTAHFGSTTPFFA